MKKVIIGVGIFLIIIGIIGIGAEILTAAELSKTGGRPGGFPIPQWATLFIVYQALLPFAMVGTGGVLVKIGLQNNDSEKS